MFAHGLYNRILVDFYGKPRAIYIFYNLSVWFTWHSGVCVCVYALFSTDFSFHLLHHPIPFLLNFCMCFFAVESDSMYKYVHAKAERKKNDGSLAV